jgi:hypothetical protein
MQSSNLIRTAKGVLTLMVLAGVPAISARAMQPQPTAVVQDAAQPQQSPSQSDQSKDKQKTFVVTGTIIKSGSDFVLKDAKGIVYRLDAQDKAAPFENKPVKVTGKLEPAASENQTAMLHVDAIEPMSV